jgi:hypothetical protein
MRKSNLGIEKVRREAFIENSGFADFDVCAGVCCGNSVPGTR